MKNRAPWFIAAAAIGFSGFVFAGATHQNLAEGVDNKQPGKLQVDYVQPGAGIGKFMSLVFAGGFAGCLYMGLREEKAEDVVQTQTEAIAPASTQAQTQAVAQKRATKPVYDEDPEIDLDDDAVEETEENVDSQKPETKAPGKLLVFDRIYTNIKRHIFVPAETGAGKTTLMLGAIEYGYNLFDGQIEFFGSTAKRSPFLGLEDQIAEDGLPRILFINPDDPTTIKPLLKRLSWLRKRLVKRGDIRTDAEKTGRPYNPKRNIIILDEWNETLEIAKEYDREYNLSVKQGEAKSDAHGELLAFINSFARTGREDEMVIWAFCQDHQVQNAGVNTGYRKNFAFLVPAKEGSMLGLEDALTGRSPIVSSVPKGKEILAQAQAVAQQNPSVGIVYCNVSGHEILITPHLPDIKRKRLFSAEDGGKVVQGRFPKTTSQEVPQAVGATNYQLDEVDYWS